MTKKMEEAVDEILILYFSGVKVADAMDKVMKKLKPKEQFELKEKFKEVLDRRN